MTQLYIPETVISACKDTKKNINNILLFNIFLVESGKKNSAKSNEARGAVNQNERLYLMIIFCPFLITRPL